MRELIVHIPAAPWPATDTATTDPWTLKVPAAAVIVVGLLGFWNARWEANRAGMNSAESLRQTIEADRTGRVLERQLDLYADIPTFVGERRQHREVGMAVMTIEGVKQLDPFDAAKIFDVLGRAHALADADVLSAFDVADNADMAAWRSWNFVQFVRGSEQPGNDIVKRTEQIFADKEAANVADAALEAAVRVSLHREPAPAIQRPEIKEEAVAVAVAAI